MTNEQASFSEAQLERVSAKFQAFYDELAVDEKSVMQALLRRAAGETDVSGYGPFDLPITINGRTIVLSPYAGGSVTDPDRGKDGATTSGQPGGTQTGSGTKTVGFTIRF